MWDLLPLAEKLGARLKARGETIAVTESSAGGLVNIQAKLGLVEIKKR